MCCILTLPIPDGVLIKLEYSEFSKCWQTYAQYNEFDKIYSVGENFHLYSKFNRKFHLLLSGWTNQLNRFLFNNFQFISLKPMTMYALNGAVQSSFTIVLILVQLLTKIISWTCTGSHPITFTIATHISKDQNIISRSLILRS